MSINFTRLLSLISSIEAT